AGGSYPRYRNYVWQGLPPGAHLGAALYTEPVSDEVRALAAELGVTIDPVPEIPIDINGDGKADSREDLLAFFAEPKSPTSFRPILKPFYYRDPVSGEIRRDDLLNYLGKPTPDWSGSFGANIGFLRHFRFAALFEYKAGNYQVNNLTDAFRKSHGLIGRNTPEAAATEMVLLNPSSTPEQRLEAAERWVKEFLALSPYSGLNTIEKADFIRMREISLAYDVPRDIAAMFGLRNATVSVAGRNLWLITGYTGIDQEMNAIGRRSGGGTNANFLDGVDAFGFPIPRQFVFSLKVGF
ncbi:MAG: hypothetical protein D6741_12770, partial [Planctomycetota bacterium]